MATTYTLIKLCVKMQGMSRLPIPHIVSSGMICPTTISERNRHFYRSYLCRNTSYPELIGANSILVKKGAMGGYNAWRVYSTSASTEVKKVEKERLPKKKPKLWTSESSKIMLVSETGTLSSVTLDDAKSIAKKKGLELVHIVDNKEKPVRTDKEIYKLVSKLSSMDSFDDESQDPITDSDSIGRRLANNNVQKSARSSQAPAANDEAYFPRTVAEIVQSVRTPYYSPLKLVNATDPNVLEEAVKLDVSSLLKCYLGLSKSRLTGLVVVTAMAGYALAPAPFTLGSFLSVSLGTALTSAAANTINQIVEVPYDSQMDRTKNRVLVRNKLSKEHAAAFAAISGVSGLTLLTLGANGLTAALGGLNLLLYTCVYTPMKRRSIANTWVGSVVGGIPPLMGWVACTGEITHGALLLGGILYAWQFPHFNALSWNLRNDYDKAGYKMMAVTHPELCRKTSLRYSLSLILISSLAPVCNVTSWTFVVDSLPLNGYLAYLAYRFYKEGDSASSRKLFRFSLIHLPTLILLMMVSKQAYKDKECPVTAAINEATTTSSIAPPPPVPVAFLSINHNDTTKSSTATADVNCLEKQIVSSAISANSDISAISRSV